MLKVSRILVIIMILCLLLAACTQNDDFTNKASDAGEAGKIIVYASFYPMYDFASKIGGDKICLTNMVPAGTEPHSWEPTAKDIVALENADIFIYNGAGMEHWVDKVLASLENTDLITVEASEGITLLKGTHHHHDDTAAEAEEIASEGEQTQYDPHVWLSPLNAEQELENIKNAFVKADPDNAAYYKANYAKYASEFELLDKEYRDTITSLPNKNIVVAHQAFAYLCNEYGLNQVAIEGLSADSEPNPARMAEIIEFVKTNKVKYIFFEELISPKVAETIAQAAGVKTAVLNPLGALSDEEKAVGGDYLSVMHKNLQALKVALQ
ncbi:MAG: metal ABC transporter substrate-binding protein [Clostridia bacterium]|nr:metal ABC transporter substrate-binding protein [Clostridia bacterium]